MKFEELTNKKNKDTYFYQRQLTQISVLWRQKNGTFLT